LFVSTAILIVHYRTYADLDRCLESLRPHLRAGDEIVVVDYESDPDALRAVTGSHPSVIAVPQPTNSGFAAGVNLGASRSRAPYLLLLNPDTLVEGPVPAVLEEWLASHPDVGVAGARVLNADGSVQPSARRFPDLTTWLGGRSTTFTAWFPQNWFARRNLVGREATLPLDVDWISGACLMTRRDVFERVGGFDAGFFLYWEDADYCSRVADAGFRRMYVPTVAVRHAAGRSAARDPAIAIREFHRSAFRLYWKRASLAGRIVAPLVYAGLWFRRHRRERRAVGVVTQVKKS
jgi:GT2 family glycosyltransferase